MCVLLCPQKQGLARRFVYFNDDVFLSADTWPEDFYPPNGGQKFYPSWGVPQCHEGCMENWIGDGFCDAACNHEPCDFDFPDCNGTEPAQGGAGGKGDTSSSSSGSPSWGGNTAASGWGAAGVARARGARRPRVRRHGGPLALGVGWPAGPCLHG